MIVQKWDYDYAQLKFRRNVITIKVKLFSISSAFSRLDLLLYTHIKCILPYVSSVCYLPRRSTPGGSIKLVSPHKNAFL